MDEYKITQSEIEENNVKSAPNMLMGNPEDNKNVFDKLPELIAGKFNSFVTAVKTKFADYYTKTEIDRKVETIDENIGEKANSADVFTKSATTTYVTAVKQDIEEKIPDKVSALTNDAGYVTGDEVDEMLDIPYFDFTAMTVKALVGMADSQSAYLDGNYSEFIDAIKNGDSVRIGVTIDYGESQTKIRKFVLHFKEDVTAPSYPKYEATYVEYYKGEVHIMVFGLSDHRLNAWCHRVYTNREVDEMVDILDIPYFDFTTMTVKALPNATEIQQSYLDGNYSEFIAALKDGDNVRVGLSVNYGESTGPRKRKYVLHFMEDTTLGYSMYGSDYMEVSGGKAHLMAFVVTENRFSVWSYYIYTNTEVDSKIKEVRDEISALDEYAKDISERVPSCVSDLDNDANYATKDDVQDEIEQYVSYHGITNETYVNEKVAGLATETYVDERIAGADIDLSAYAKKEDVEEVYNIVPKHQIETESVVLARTKAFTNTDQFDSVDIQAGKIKAGDEVFVTWRGTTYLCVAQAVTDNTNIVWIITDTNQTYAEYTDGTNEPIHFFIYGLSTTAANDTANKIQVQPKDDFNTVTYTILVKTAEELVKLPLMCLPDDPSDMGYATEKYVDEKMAVGIGECVTFDFSTFNGETIQCDKTWEEIIFAILSGKQLYAKVTAPFNDMDNGEGVITVMSPFNYCYDTTTNTVSFSGAVYMNSTIMLASVYSSGGDWSFDMTTA